MYSTCLNRSNAPLEVGEHYIVGEQTSYIAKKTHRAIGNFDRAGRGHQTDKQEKNELAARYFPVWVIVSDFYSEIAFLG